MIKQYWQLIWKHRIWVIAPALIASIGAAGYVVSTEPVYLASARLLLEQRDRTLSAIGSEMGELGELSSLSRNQNPIDTQIELVKSGGVVSRVIEAEGLKDGATGELLTVAEFLANAKVKNVKGTDLVQVSYEHVEPAKARQIVTTWAQEYIRENRNNHRREASKAVKFLSEQERKVKADLTKAENDLRNFQQANRTIDISQEARTAVQDASDMSAELRNARAQYRESQTRVQALRGQIGLTSSDALASTALSNDPTIQTLREQLIAAETNPLLATASANHPDVRHLRAQIHNLRTALQQRAQAIMGRTYRGRGLQENLDPIRQGLARELVEAEVQSLAHQTRVEALSNLESHLGRQLHSLPGKQLHLTRLSRQVAVTGEHYKMLVQKLEEARLQEALNIGNVTLVENAEEPVSPVRPKKLQSFLLAIVAGLGLGVALAFLLEHLDDTVKTIEEAEKTLPLTVLGVVPWMSKRSKARLIALSEPRSPVSEAYRTLRTNLKFIGADTLKVLTVTSAGPGEGKSTTLANLAIACAQTGRRVLLVDADMRKPTLHDIFSLEAGYGLSSVLSNEVPLAAAVRRGPLPTLDVLPCGPIPADPADLLESATMETFLQEARASYDLVLLDAPPIIAVTDASILAGRGDGLVLMVGVNKVSHRAVKQALKLLQTAHVKVLGMVIRGMRPDHDPYYSSYYHSYYGQVEKVQKARPNRKAG